ncbi:hypothetical protein ACFP1C_11680 [Levilactobacillus fujinensis]|uniref:Uncharacterized protein n=1 Tax=Levilactobacillus fujinensis TaxID=2486024 RepID=A0ABW1TIT4_9LACO
MVKIWQRCPTIALPAGRYELERDEYIFKSLQYQPSVDLRAYLDVSEVAEIIPLATLVGWV